MNIKLITLWACLLTASVSYGISQKHESRSHKKTAIKQESSRSKTKKSNEKSSKKASDVKATRSKSYKVDADDNDWDIAHKHGITVKQLRAMNGGKKLEKLRPGQAINVPAPVEKAKPKAKVASKSKAKSVDSTPTNSIKSTYAKTVKDSVIVREKPNTDADKLKTIDAGTVGKICGAKNGWYKLQFATYAGWIRSDMLGSASKPKPVIAAAPPKPKSAVVASAVDKNKKKPAIQKQPSRDKRSSGTVVASSKSEEGVIGVAKSLLGTRYVWGGTSRGGFDCSGFVGYVMRAAGVNLPRTAREQATRGSYVSRSDLRAGDLIFFNTRGGISHVGIFIGEGNFIHASSGGGKVRIDPLSKDYYSKRYVTARRVGNFSTVKKALETVQEDLEESGDLIKPANKSEAKVRQGADEIEH